MNSVCYPNRGAPRLGISMIDALATSLEGGESDFLPLRLIRFLEGLSGVTGDVR
jgi:hypothetical protein